MSKTKFDTWQEYFVFKGENPNALSDTLAKVDMPERLRKSTIARHILITIIEIENGGWIPDYEPYFNVEKYGSNSSGFGLSYYGYVYDAWTTGTGCGVRLCFKDYDTCKNVCNKFIKIYEDLHLN